MLTQTRQINEFGTGTATAEMAMAIKGALGSLADDLETFDDDSVERRY